MTVTVTLGPVPRLPLGPGVAGPRFRSCTSPARAQSRWLRPARPAGGTRDSDAPDSESGVPQGGLQVIASASDNVNFHPTSQLELENVTASGMLLITMPVTRDSSLKSAPTPRPRQMSDPGRARPSHCRGLVWQCRPMNSSRGAQLEDKKTLKGDPGGTAGSQSLGSDSEPTASRGAEGAAA